MTSADFATAGFITQLATDGEAFSTGGATVAAIVNREPTTQTMEDAGYLAKEPMTLEVLRGSKTDTETVWLGGVNCNLSLRGCVPAIHQVIIIDGWKRKIMRLTNQQDRWLIYAIKLSVIDNPTTT